MYDLRSPPLFADLKTHAAAINAHGLTVSPRSMGDWPIDQPVMNGKRQPSSTGVWAYVLTLMPTEQRPLLLQRMSPDFRAEVEDMLPAAMEAKRIAAERRKAKAGAGGGGGRGAHFAKDAASERPSA